MTNRLQIAAIALLAAALSACGGGEGGHATEGPAVKTAPNSMASMPAGDIARGRVIAEQKSGTRQACADCHGPQGNKPIDGSYPRLAGQYTDYLQHTLAMYRDGERDQAVMGIQAKELTDQEISDVAAYYGSQDGYLGDLAQHH